MRSSRDLKTLTTQPRRYRRLTIIDKKHTGFQQVEVVISSSSSADAFRQIIDSASACSFDERQVFRSEHVYSYGCSGFPEIIVGSRERKPPAESQIKVGGVIGREIPFSR